MKSRIKMAFIMMTICICICACSKQEEQIEKQELNIVEFSKDKMTVRKQQLSSNNNTDNNKDTNGSNTEHNEINISGEDTTPSYEVIDNAHVRYNNTTYKNLYTNVNNMEIPYDKVTFINFIVKTYKPTSDTVTTILSSDNNEIIDNGEVAGGSSGLSIAEGLKQFWSEYDSVKSKYGADVKYQLNIYQGANNNMAIIYSCKEYMLYRGTSGDMTVDMNVINGGE